MSPSAPVPHVTAAVLGRLRETLFGAGFTEHALNELIATPARLGSATADAPVHARRVQDDGGLSTLVRLFALGAPVGLSQTVRALAPVRPAQLEAGGLVEIRGETVRCPFRIWPFAGVLLCYDGDLGPAEREYVTGVNPAARTLAALTVRKHVGTALDLGTGGGIQALLAAGHSGTVVGSDLSPRALVFADINARLNGAANVDFRAGRWFDPVDGARFDLIVANPPYGVSPESGLLYRDGGLTGDAVSQKVVSEAPDHLKDGGLAHVLCNWITATEADRFERPLRWVEGTDCDALVLHYATVDAVSYAASWNHDLQRKEAAAFEQTLDRWLAAYAELGITRLSDGAVILRRRSGGANWTLALDVTTSPSGLGGAHVERLFAAQDFLRGLRDDSELLEQRLELVEGHRLDQRLVYAGRRYPPAAASISVEPGIGLVGTVDPLALPVLVGCDGSRSLRELLELADPELAGDDQTVTSTVVPAIRRLVELGFLVPATS